MRLKRACCVVAILTFTEGSARAEAQEPEGELGLGPQPAEPTPKPQPPENAPPPPRFALGPSLAIGMTTPSSGNLFTNVYGLVDLRFVVAIRAVGPLWVRLEPGTTLSWNNVNQLGVVVPGGTSYNTGVPIRSETVRVYSVGLRALAAIDVSSRAVVRSGGTIAYGGAALPDWCGGETHGGAGFGGVLGGGFRPDADRHLEIGVETGVFIYPYADKCLVNPAGQQRVSLQENPELAFTVGATWFIF